MRLAALLALGLLTACGASPYAPYNNVRGGYRETQLDVDTFKVEFLGNEYTDSSKAGDYGLLRSAEVCLENGYPYFAQLSGSQVSNFTSAGIIGGITQGRGIYLVKCQKQKASDASINAEITRRNLRKKYQLPGG